MTKFFLTLVMIAGCNVSNAQFYKSVLPTSAFTDSLEKIVVDFRLNYETIKGEMLSQVGEVDTYESTVKLPGSTACIIQHFHSIVDTTASWQGVMYNGDDYNEAVKVYNNLCRMMKKTQIHWIDRSLVGFSGEIKPVKQEMRFAITTLNLNLEDARYKEFKAQIELLNNYDRLEVHINLLTKKPDEEGNMGNNNY